VIWSTYPIATAHLIGLCLHRMTGIPWVADLRDPMTDDSHPSNPAVRRAYQWIEEKTIKHCTRAVVTTPGAIDTYMRRFPHIPASRFVLIENAFDEENFVQAEQHASFVRQDDKPFTLVHSGVIYPWERDPVPLFEALAALLSDGTISARKFQLLLRATGHDSYLAELIEKYGIGGLVTLAPHVAYRDALQEMLNADGLLILQASNCNHQVPAKLYEYLRAGRPILALTDPIGDTAATLRAAGIDTIAPLDEKDAIIQAIARFLTLAETKQAPVATAETVRANSRLARTRVLAALLDEVALEANAKAANQTNSSALTNNRRGPL
jgi:glycosyltransferase involved in cell wall biosynthesis